MIENKGSYYIDHEAKEVRWKHGHFKVGINHAKILGYSYPESYGINLANDSHWIFYKLWECAFYYSAYQSKKFFADLHLLKKLDKREILYTKNIHKKYYKVLEQKDYLKIKEELKSLNYNIYN